MLVAIGVSREYFISFDITCRFSVPDTLIQPTTTLKKIRQTNLEIMFNYCKKNNNKNP